MEQVAKNPVDNQDNTVKPTTQVTPAPSLPPKVRTVAAPKEEPQKTEAKAAVNPTKKSPTPKADLTKPAPARPAPLPTAQVKSAPKEPETATKPVDTQLTQGNPGQAITKEQEVASVKPAPVTKKTGLKYFVDTGLSADFATRLNHDRAEFNTGRASLAVGVLSSPRNPWFWDASMIYEYTSIGISSMDSFGGSSAFPLDQGYQLTANLGLRRAINKKWGVWGRVLPSSQAQYQSNFDESLRLTGMLGGDVQLNDKWNIQFGLLALLVRLEEDPLWIPIVGFRFVPNPKWEMGTRGPGFYGRLNLKPSLFIEAQAMWMVNEWRLNESSQHGGGALEEMRVPLRVSLGWRPDKAWLVSPYIGSSVWSRYTLRDDRGQTLEARSADPNVNVGANIRYEF
jgi:hypothetical protein